jgi:aminopeptidase N
VRSLGIDGQPDGPTTKIILDTAPVPLHDEDSGLTVINAGGWGVFRTGYDTDHRLALASHLDGLTPLERANLLADTWATTLAGRTSLREFLTLAARLGLEADPAPWAPVGSALLVSSRIAREADRGSLHQAIDALGFESQAGEGERTPTLRALAINLLGTIGADPGVREEAAARFDASPIGGGGGHPIPADVESATLAVVAQLLRPGDYDALLERYRTATTPQEEVRSLQALSAFPDVDLAQRTFDLAMTEVRSQNGYFVIAGLLTNPVAGQAIWQRMTESWDDMFKRFSKNVHSRLVEPIPAFCGDAAFARRVIEFLVDHPIASGPRRVLQSIERLEVQLAFAARERDGLGATCQAILATAHASVPSGSDD